MRSQLQLTVALGGLALTAACTNTSGLPPAPPNPEPVKAEYIQPYYLQVGDVLAVRLMLNPELNEDAVTVRPDGRISTTVAGDIPAAGHTVAEVTQALRQAYHHDLQNPRLIVEVRSFAPERVYVGGEVNNPGEFVTVGPALTLSQAISRAGGVKLSGDNGNVFIIRRPAANVAPQLLSVRYSDVIHARDAAADVVLAPYDTVYVPKTGIAEVYAIYNQYMQQFVNPSFGFNYIVNPGNTGAVVTGPSGATATVTPSR